MECSYNSSEPFTVGFAEPYDSAWKLKYTRMVRKWVGKFDSFIRGAKCFPDKRDW